MKPDLTIVESEWPKGHRLFSALQGALHMSFDPPEEGSMPAILFRLHNPDTMEVLRVKAFTSDQDALAWFASEWRKRQ